MSSATLDNAVREAMLVLLGLRSTCLLEAAAAAAADCVFACARCLLGPAASRQAALLDVGGSTFLVCLPRLRQRLRQVQAAEDAGACEGDACEAPLCPCAVRVQLCPAPQLALPQAEGGDVEADSSAVSADAACGLRASLQAVAAALGGGVDDLCGGVGSLERDDGEEGSWRAAPARGKSAGSSRDACAVEPASLPLPRVRVTPPAGACHVALAGWLLEYPHVFACADGDPAAAALTASLSGANLLLCSAIYYLPARADGSVAGARCRGALHARLTAQGAGAGAGGACGGQLASVESRVTFSCLCDDGCATRVTASGGGGGGGDAAGDDAALNSLPATTRAQLRRWQARLRSEAHAAGLRAPPVFLWRQVCATQVAL